jgi:hypothetical protein
VHPLITSQIVSDMQERRIRRAADHALGGPRRAGLFTAVRARLTARRAAVAARRVAVRTSPG